MARLQTRAQHRAAREASSSVRPVARRAKSPSAVRVASGREAEPAAEPPAESLGLEATSAAVRLRPDLPSLRRLLCLHCAKHAVVDPSSSCSFDKEKSKMCFYCRSQKSKCFPVSAFLPRWLLY